MGEWIPGPGVSWAPPPLSQAGRDALARYSPEPIPNAAGDVPVGDAMYHGDGTGIQLTNDGGFTPVQQEQNVSGSWAPLAPSSPPPAPSGSTLGLPPTDYSMRDARLAYEATERDKPLEGGVTLGSIGRRVGDAFSLPKLPGVSAGPGGIPMTAAGAAPMAGAPVQADPVAGAQGAPPGRGVGEPVKPAKETTLPTPQTPRTRVGGGTANADPYGIKKHKANIAGLEDEVAGNYGMQMESAQRLIEATEEGANARLEKEIEAEKAHEARLTADKAADDAGRAALQAYRQKTDGYIDEVANTEVDPRRVYRNMDTSAKFSVLLGAAMGGIMQGGGWTKDNPFMTTMNKMVDDDIRAQEHNIATKKWRVNQRETVYEQMRREGVDAKTARDIYTEGLYKRALKQAELMARKFDNKVALEKLEQLKIGIGRELLDYKTIREERALKEAQTAAAQAAQAALVAAKKQEEQRKQFNEFVKENMKYFGYENALRAGMIQFFQKDPTPGVPLSNIKPILKEAGQVEAERLALETAVPALGENARLPKELAQQVNSNVFLLTERNKLIAELLPMLGTSDSALPGEAKGHVIAKIRNIANISRRLAGSGVPNEGDKPFLLVVPDEVPNLDIFRQARGNLEEALQNDMPRYLSSVASGYKIPYAAGDASRTKVR